MSDEHTSRWMELSKRLVNTNQEDTVVVPLTTPEELVQFEREWDFQLPDSYKAFCQIIGAGEIAETFQITTPYAPGTYSDLSQDNRMWRENYFNDTIGSWKWRRQLSRVIRFASDYTGASYAWDPVDIVDVDRHEYGVYYMPRADDLERPRRIETTFARFIEVFILGGGFQKTFRKSGLLDNIELLTFSKASM